MNPFFYDNSFLVLLLALWTIPWKVYAIWLSVKHNHKKWFLALLILNTVGILEIFYIFKIANKSWDEVKKDFHRAWTSFRK